MPITTEYPMASPWRRLASLVYDSFLIFALLFAATVLYQSCLQWFSPPVIKPAHLMGDVIHEIPIEAQGWVFQLYLFMVISCFYCYFWRHGGQTLAMQAWRIKLVSADGQRVSLKQCALRMLGGIPSLLLAGAGYWWIWLDPDQLAWHDRLSNTRVILLPKPPKGKNQA